MPAITLTRAGHAALLAGCAAIATSSVSAGEQAIKAPGLEDLSQQVRALEQGQEAMRRDLTDIKRLLMNRSPTAAPPAAQTIDKTVAIGAAPARGSAQAPLTLVEFSDYQCPVCRRFFDNTLPSVQKDFIDTGKLRHVYRDFPLESMHKDALRQAEAAHCAGDQGKYWQMHDQLFSHPLPPTAENLATYAAAIGLDNAALQACLASGKYTETVRSSAADGQQLGVRGTPSFFIGTIGPDGKLKAVRSFVGAPPYPVVKKTLEDLLVPKS